MIPVLCFHINFHLFADDTSLVFSHKLSPVSDDTSLVFSHKDEKAIENTVNGELKQVANWLSANKLSLNVSKSNLLLFHPPQKKLKEIVIQINGQKIPLKQTTKYLGVILDNQLTWHGHV